MLAFALFLSLNNKLIAATSSKCYKDLDSKIDYLGFLAVLMNFSHEDKNFLNKLVINKTKGYKADYFKGKKYFSSLFDFLISIGNDKRDICLCC